MARSRGEEKIVDGKAEVDWEEYMENFASGPSLPSTREIPDELPNYENMVAAVTGALIAIAVTTTTRQPRRAIELWRWLGIAVIVIVVRATRMRTAVRNSSKSWSTSIASPRR